MVSEPARDRPKAVNERDRRNCTESYHLEHSTIRIEQARAGPVARIKRPDDSDEWAGPLDDSTVEALREVAANER